MLFKFVILFQSFKPIPLFMLSIIPLLFLSRHYTPITQWNRYFRSQTNTPHFHSNFQQNRCNSARFCENSLRHFCSLHTTFISTPFILLCLTTFPTIIKLFSLDVFHSLPPNHTNQIAAPIIQNCRLFHFSYNPRHFQSKRHSVPHFDSTSTRLHSTFIYWFPPHNFLFQL